MTRPGQKKKELLIAQEYVKIRQWNAVVVPGSEPPDVLIRFPDGSVIGAEITEYFQPWRTSGGYTLRQVEAAWHSIRQYVVEYRKKSQGLENLSVALEFRTHDVPSTRFTAAFVAAVAAKIRLALASSDHRKITIRIGEADDQVLRQYLLCVHIRRVNAYLEWDWNHSVGGVGTSDAELSTILERKLRWKPPSGEISRFHLVVGGDGSGISQVMAPFSADQLNDFTSLNAALDGGPYEEVALLSLNDFLWTRDHRWRAL
ncbi:MAG: hypothetical protein KBA31_21330 [Alphaproteobacteria bacterium]|nr:hypothetical protein [Alphaproteobacteria bacterium]